MGQTKPPTNSIVRAISVLRDYPIRWILPTILITGLTFAYAALVHKPEWQAWQALTVRDEVTQNSDRPGQFDDVEGLKHAQETILELARSPSVVAAALSEIGPPADYERPDQWPTEQDTAATRDNIEIVPPGGAEFGTTELFYLTVTNVDRERAIRFANILCDQFESRFKELRNSKAQSLIDELTNTVQLSRDELRKSTSALAELEASVGSDLAELRMLHDSIAGESNLQTTLAEMRQELRQAETAQQGHEDLLDLLSAAQENPANLVATPSQLLQAHPALERLKDGLVDAQLNTSRLLGTMSRNHPRVQAALVAEDEIRGHLHRELDLAIRGLRAEQSMSQSRIQTLSRKINNVEERLQRLAAMRAEYSNQVAEVQQHTQSLTIAQQNLNAARASLAAAGTASLVTRIDDPQTGPNPIGPRRAIIVAAGLCGGLLIGLGILFLTTTPPEFESEVVKVETEIEREPESEPEPARVEAEAERKPEREPEPAQAEPPQDQPLPDPATNQEPPTKRSVRNMTLKEALSELSELA